MLLCTSLRDIFGLGHDEIKEIKVCSRQKQKSASAVKMCNEMASEVFLNFRKLNLTIELPVSLLVRYRVQCF